MTSNAKQGTLNKAKKPAAQSHDFELPVTVKKRKNIKKSNF
jgi:hypothetical protein